MTSHAGKNVTTGKTSALQQDSLPIRGWPNSVAASFGDLNKLLEALNEKSSEYVGDMPTQRSTHEIQELNQIIRTHRRRQDERLREAKKAAQDDLKSRISDRLRRDINQHIRSEIVTQVRQQVDIQIAHYIPVSLGQQALDIREQLKETETSLQNSEARMRNSSIQYTDLDEPLAPILVRDGTTSSLYPSDLRSLFCYEDEVVKALVKEYDLPEDELFETNLERFMRHIGIEKFELKINV
ncbi:hypothetical protein BDZ94DRAFT_48995 [Collybia nuda]|uniref:Uncharacterized protein n=1 Tax=Collybia nuda TaxID=64659 RepID=A0A9P5YHH2_9AGAR|nr:hypothetical protein BDZ94DRAFT_48995 [Collybia nuda]